MQLISLFLLRENSKNAFSIFVFILMAGVFVSRDENSLLDLTMYITNYSKMITHQAEIFQGKRSTIVIFIPFQLCVKSVNIFVFRSYQCCAGAENNTHTIRSYYRCCCINEPVIFSDCVHLKTRTPIPCPVESLF